MSQVCWDLTLRLDTDYFPWNFYTIILSKFHLGGQSVDVKHAWKKKTYPFPTHFCCIYNIWNVNSGNLDNLNHSLITVYFFLLMLRFMYSIFRTFYIPDSKYIFSCSFGLRFSLSLYLFFFLCEDEIGSVLMWTIHR